VREELSTLGEFEQLVALEILVDRYSGDAAILCAALPQRGRVGERCARWRDRPHLTVRPVYLERNPRRKRAGTGPDSGLLPMPEVPAISASSEVALPDDCAPGDKCVRSASKVELLKTTPEAAVGICAAGYLPTGKDYSECVFELAEAAATMNGIGGMSQSLGLCVASGWAKACFHHVLALSLPAAAAADAPGPAQLSAIRMAIEEVRRTVGAEQADLYEDYLWSLWTFAAFRSGAQISGDLLDVLPQQAAPHVVQAAAYHFLRKQPDALAQGLDALTDALLQALDKRYPRASPGAGISINLFKPGQQFWQRDHGAAEADIPAIYCMGASRRARTSDPRLDAKLAILEAAAVLGGPSNQELFSSLVGSEQEELVRWTAARILSQAWPHTDWAAQLTDPSPLVMGRLAR